MSEKFNDVKIDAAGTIMQEGRFKVPFSQRNYSWWTDKKDDQVGRLWSDFLRQFGIWKRTQEDIAEQDAIINSSSRTPEERKKAKEQRQLIIASGAGEYFLGPMVFVKTDNTRYRGRFAIVDGQQRLTTITMMICIIRDFLIKYSVQLEHNPKPELHQAVMDIVKFVEMRKHDLAGINIHEDDGWRLELNSVDKDIFENVILAWKTSEHNGNPDKFEEEDRTSRAIPGINPPCHRQYLDIEKKEKWMREQLGKKICEESIEKLMTAYIKLKENIFNAIVTDFVPDSEDRDDLLKNMKEQAEIDADTDLRTSPGHHGLIPDFFSGFAGLDTLQNKSWDSAYETLLKQKMEREYGGTKPFSEWIDKVLLPKILKTDTGNSSVDPIAFETYRENLIEKKKQEKLEAKATANLGRLVAFSQNVLADKMFHVKVQVKSMTDAFQVFETLNNTGEPLTNANLIKNLVLEELDIDNEMELKEYADRWDKIIRTASKPNDFIRESLRSRGIPDDNDVYTFNNYKLPDFSFPVKVEEGNLFKIIESQIVDSDSAKKHLKELEIDIEIVKQLDDPSLVGFDDLKSSLYSLSDIEGKYVRIPIITAWRKWGEDPDAENKIENNSNDLLLLTKFLVLWFWKYKTIRGQSATNVDGWMTKCCEIIQNTNDRNIALSTIIKFLLQFSDSIQFRSRFWEKASDIESGLAKHVLYHITSWLGSRNPDVEPIKNLELEHILPKKPLESGIGAWDSNAFYQNYEPNDQRVKDLITKYELSEREKHIPKQWDSWNSRLGNFTILNKKINNKIKNKNYITKRDYQENGQPAGYKDSDLRINTFTVIKKEDETIDDKQQWADRTEWTALDILERTEYFVKIAEEMFRLPFLICGNENCTYRDPDTKPIIITGKNWTEINDAPCPHCSQNDIQIWWPKNNAPAYRVSDNQQCPYDVKF